MNGPMICPVHGAEVTGIGASGSVGICSAGGETQHLEPLEVTA
jgi:hypothetical protein